MTGFGKNPNHVMENASAIINDEDGAASWIIEGSPWITYVSLALREPEDALSTEVLEFIKDMVNREAIIGKPTIKKL